MSYLERDTNDIHQTHTGPGPHLLGIHTLTGENVVNHKAEELGNIKEILLDMRTGKIVYAVLSLTIFNLREKLFAVPWAALTLDAVNKRFVVNIERSRLVDAPCFEKDAWPDMTDTVWTHRLHAYYGTSAFQDIPAHKRMQWQLA